MKQLVRPQQTVWLGLIMLLGMLVWPHVALADAPVTRGLQRTSVGSVDHSMLWSDIQPMPPLDKMLRPAESEVARPGAAPGQTFTLPAPGYQDTAEGNSWVSRVLNPGNWIMDAGMGISTGLLATMSDIVLATVRHLIDAPGGCIGVVFCTPEATLFDSTGVISVSLSTVWGRLIPVAGMLLTCFFVVRVGQIAMAGPHQFGAEGRNLVIMMIGAFVMITHSGAFLRALVTFFNIMNGAILATDGSRLLELMLATPPLNFGVILTQLIFLLAFLCLLFLGYLRLFKLFLLFALAPLMGALLLLPTQASYFKNWVNTILALLAEQTVWVVAFMIGITLAMPGGAIPDITDPANNAETIRHFVGATIAIVIALCSRSLLSSVFQTVAPAGASFGLFRALTAWQFVRRMISSDSARGGSHGTGSATAQGTAAGHRAGGQDTHAAGMNRGNGTPSAGSAGRSPRNAGPVGGSSRGAIPPVARSTSVAGNGNRTARVRPETGNGQIIPGTRAHNALGQRGRELDPLTVAAGVAYAAAPAKTMARQPRPATPTRIGGGARVYTIGAGGQRRPRTSLVVDVQPQPGSPVMPSGPAADQRLLPNVQSTAAISATEQRALPAPPRVSSTTPSGRQAAAPGIASSRRRASRFSVARTRAGIRVDQRHVASMRVASPRPAIVDRRIDAATPALNRQDAPQQGTSQHSSVISRRTRLAWHPGMNRRTATRITMQQRLAMEEPATPPFPAMRLHDDPQRTGIHYHPRTATARMYRAARVGASHGRHRSAEQQSRGGWRQARYTHRKRAMLRRRSEQRKEEA